MNVAEFKENVLKVWVEDGDNPEAETLAAYGKTYVATLRKGDVTLFTTPAQNAVYTGFNYVYEDGLACIFVRDGKWTWGLDDDQRDGQGVVYGFDRFLEKHDVTDCEWISVATSRAPTP